MKIKNLILCITVITFGIFLTSCGINNEEFINAVESYQIFDDENAFEMKTVSDFIEKMESYDKENDKILTMVSASWSEERIEETSNLIESIKKDSDFNYDKNKYYGALSVNVCIASSKDYSTKEDFTYTYLFSLNDNKVIPEASAKHYGSTYDYEEICTDSASIQDSMSACILITDIATQLK